MVLQSPCPVNPTFGPTDAPQSGGRNEFVQRQSDPHFWKMVPKQLYF